MGAPSGSLGATFASLDRSPVHVSVGGATKNGEYLQTGCLLPSRDDERFDRDVHRDVVGDDVGAGVHGADDTWRRRVRFGGVRVWWVEGYLCRRRPRDRRGR